MGPGRKHRRENRASVSTEHAAAYALCVLGRGTGGRTPPPARAVRWKSGLEAAAGF